jgi:hypothetical protein
VPAAQSLQVLKKGMVIFMYDIIVVGGGISGCTAAISAARCGVKVLLIEQYGFLGGMLTSGGVGPMMTFHAGETKVIQGITDEVIERLVKKGKSPGHIFDTTGYTYSVTPFDAEALKHELELMFIESGGQLLYHTMLAEVQTEEHSIKSITVCNKNGLTKLSAKFYIDATGDGDLSAWGHVPFTLGKENSGKCQALTMNMKMNRVDIGGIKDYIRENMDEFPRLKNDVSLIDRADRLSIGGFEITVKKAMEEGRLTGVRSDLLFFETNNPGEVIVNTTRIMGLNPTDPYDLTTAEIQSRKLVRELEAFLKSDVRGFEDAVLLYSGPTIGIRSSRQIKGIYTLTLNDLLEQKKFADVIACGGYPIDVHPTGPEELNKVRNNAPKHICEGEIYSIPLRSLVNAEIDNIVTVGRCISAEFEAQGAIRVTPIAGAIGHGGGAAAAVAVATNMPVREISIEMLHDILIKQGAFLNLKEQDKESGKELATNEIT